MKKQILFVFAMMIAFGLSAQKIKLTEGDTKFLKGQDEIGVKFTYDANLMVGSGTEQEYIDKKMADADEKEPGTGEAWLEAWYADRPEHFHPKFIDLFEAVLKKYDVALIERDNSNTQYTMIVNTTFIEPGFNVGMASKKASVDMYITFVETANPENVMARYKILKSPGTAMYDLGARVGESYAKAAKYFAKTLLKEKAF